MNKRGTTITEIIVMLSCIAFISVALVNCRAFENARVRKDQGQIKGIVATFSIFAEADRNERFPIPGEINRLPIELDTATYAGFGNNNMEVQGKGDQDHSINLSGWLHSAMIGDNYYDTSILISANENNPIVAVKGGSTEEIPYDYQAVDPANDSYWDPMFSGDITGQGQCEGTISGGMSGVCHTSYANLALCGQRLKQSWTNGDASTIILSSRGPEHGATSGIHYSKSPTLELYGSSDSWQGIYASADGSTNSGFSGPDYPIASGMWFDGVSYTAQDDLVPVSDNAFAAEFYDFKHEPGTLIENAGGASGDTFMVLNVASTKTDVNDEWDVLLP